MWSQIDREGQQGGGREPQPLERLRRGAAAGRGLAQAPCQVLGRLLDAGHRDAGQLAGAFQRLDGGDRGAERLRQLRLRVDRLQAGADHGDARGGGCGNSGCGCDAHPAREGREPGIRRFHLAAEPSETARSGLAHAFQFGADLSPADRGKADADAFLGHLGPLGMISDSRAAHRPLEICIMS